MGKNFTELALLPPTGKSDSDLLEIYSLKEDSWRSMVKPPHAEKRGFMVETMAYIRDKWMACVRDPPSVYQIKDAYYYFFYDGESWTEIEFGRYGRNLRPKVICEL